mgnify:FL=1
MGLAFGDFKEASAPVLPRASNPKLDAEDLAKKDDDLESDGSDLSSSSDGDSDVEKSDGWKRTSKVHRWSSIAPMTSSPNHSLIALMIGLDWCLSNE